MSEGASQHRQAYAYCAYCPKMCRFACPVSESTHTETTSTWGKMTQAHLELANARPVSEHGAQALYACTGCMRCRSFCKHENEVGYALFAARENALQRGVAPKGASSTVRTFAHHGNPFGADLSAAVARYRPEGPVRFPLFPGCAALVKRPELVDDALAVSAAFAAPSAVGRAAARCCGYPLYAAGDQAAFVAHARGVAQALAPFPELVVVDPGCAYTFNIVYPRFGVSLAQPVRTIYEVLDERLEQVRARPKLAERVGYHDACHLGRGLGQYEPPRRLLSAAVEQVFEPLEARAEAGCSGGGGLLPRTWPQTAVDVARREAERAGSPGERVVTACPTSKRMFERAGRPAEDLLSVVRRWLSV